MNCNKKKPDQLLIIPYGIKNIKKVFAQLQKGKNNVWCIKDS